MAEGEKGGSSNKGAVAKHNGFIDTLFSWSLDDILDENFFKDKVKKIPESFDSVDEYFGSFAFPLLEETRAQLYSNMETIANTPFAEVVDFQESKPYGSDLYDISVDYWRNRFSNCGKEPYKTLLGDILILADAKPEHVSDLQRAGRTWVFVSVTKITDDENEDDITSTYFKVRAARHINKIKRPMFVIFLTNITTNRRIWNSLHMRGNLHVIKGVLCEHAMGHENCELCYMQNQHMWNEEFTRSEPSILNGSQVEAINACLQKLHCNHKSGIELVWGPPGTGKTRTLSTLLFSLLKMKYRTVACAPTNVAIIEVASRVLKLVKQLFEKGGENNSLFCPLGDILLFGNQERLKVATEVEEIYMDYRVRRLSECFGMSTGWRNSFTSMIDLLEECVSQYHIFVQNELMKQEKSEDENEFKGKELSEEAEGGIKSFLEFVRERFTNLAASLRRCISILCTHISISDKMFQDMVGVMGLLDSFGMSLFKDDVVSIELEEAFIQSSVNTNCILQRRRECQMSLKNLQRSLSKLDLPFTTNEYALRDFCYTNASLILCTASSSYKLHSSSVKPINFLVIDEAAQLKESEAIIPLQLHDIKHAILIGDEVQLSAMVESNISSEAGFGRSLFKRLSSLGHAKHLLDVQYRMHPSISYFPNLYFYHKQISDGPNVIKKNYNKQYLSEPMFGPYSFINVFHGREEFDEIGHSIRNLVEASVVTKILKRLHQAWTSSKRNVSIGVITPYAAQVVAIKEKLGSKYDNVDGFSVKVRSVDGFHGGEEDVIIISTVRSNGGGSIGFVANPQRTHVALTRARHCLWVLGSERTLTKHNSVWKDLIWDAKSRQCFFNADDDKDLAKAILDVKKEFDELDQLLNPESIIFRNRRWKVVFSEMFLKSFKGVRSVQKKKLVINLLLKLSNGWRPKRKKVDFEMERSLQNVKQFKVDGLYIICTVDIVKEGHYIQVLKIWNVLGLEDVPKLVKRLDNIFVKCTDDYINCCKEKSFEGNLEVPRTWAPTSTIVKDKTLATEQNGNALNSSEDGSYVENTKVSESLLLMKFYPLSSSVVSHLLSDHDGRELELPFEVTDEQLEIILYDRSTFILGRSGTGKTTILTMKLFQKEKLAMETFFGDNGGSSSKSHFVSGSKEVEKEIEGEKKPVLRQLFVTVSPKLCFAVKQHISQLKSSALGGNLPSEGSLMDIDDIDDAKQFKNIRNSFVDIPTESFPLAITFHKFLMMLDGTLGTSYFTRFPGWSKYSDGQIQGSVALEAFIRAKEVNYEGFSSLYWPHFNMQLICKLDSSRVFTEIISHIKGGLRAVDLVDGKFSREDYVQLSKCRVSTLSKLKRERIYEIFENYERMKAERGEFDLADLVFDIHHRLKNEIYKGDIMDFVYIDEVQDLTMSQIALFKYICKNVKEGFVFSGDTAQTIARGIDFRFQEIKNLFYSSFLTGSKREKGQISKVFNLSQNFRTHAGILKLSQSIIDLLYRFFPQSVDILEPGRSHIYGEPPVLLECCDNEDAIMKIFGSSGNVSSTMIGFGAEQVILVRDDVARKEIIDNVGKQALVLTILECKGLEFQDVLLCNFFCMSPLKNQWRVIYEYMKEQYSRDTTIPKCPSFSEARHSILCSELKQLYVAITRTRQRLWIWENNQELSKPMFDYWKKSCLVQVKQLDDTLAHDMRVESSAEEWRSRGIKLFHEHHYERATMCFERAGDTCWEKRSKASHLKVTADSIRVSSPQEASNILREAAEMFDAIGKSTSAAKCFYDLGDYERAGRIYLDKCEESKLENAAKCFNLAGCYEFAADVYARGYFLRECLRVCSKAKLFDMGLRYIDHWKHHVNKDAVFIRRKKEIEGIEQEFLETCAHHYHRLKDKKAMMKSVKAFHSLDLMRNFLRSTDCYEELLALEEELGNFNEAANLAKQRGNLLHASDLLEKAGNLKEASELILNFVLYNSLWAYGREGWPLEQFKQKEKLLKKARSLSKQYSDKFHEFVCSKSNILSTQQKTLSTLSIQFSDSRSYQSVRGEILCAWKILDIHLHSNISKFRWEDDLVWDLITYSKRKFGKNEISVETLICFWNCWKQNIMNVFESLERIETHESNKSSIYVDFCLSYLGVVRQYHNSNAGYFLLSSNAEWLRECGHRFSQKSGNLASLDVHRLVSSAQSYWRKELLFVGIKVLDTLEAFCKQSTYKARSIFCKFKCLVYIYEVAKSLLDSKYLHIRFNDMEKLRSFVELSITNFYGCAFPRDWRESSGSNMISLRRTEICRRMFSELILKSGRNKLLSYGQIGRAIVMTLGSSCLCNDLHRNIAESIHVDSPWKNFVEALICRNDSNNVTTEVLVAKSFCEALENTYLADWRQKDYITASCFLYLIERLLILLCCFQGFILTTKSSFVEWLIYEEGKTTNTYFSSPYARDAIGDIPSFLLHVIGELLSNFNSTFEWIKKSPHENDSSLVFLRLVVVLCLLHLNFGVNLTVLSDILRLDYLSHQLPREFYDILRRGQKHNFFKINVNMVAEALEKIGNPLMVVSLGANCSKFTCWDAIFVDMKVYKCKEDVLGILFPETTTFENYITADELEDATNLSNDEICLRFDDEVKSSNLSSSSSRLQLDQGLSTQNIEKDNLEMNHGQFWKMFESLKMIEDEKSIEFHAPTLKVGIEEGICLLTAAVANYCFDGQDRKEADEATKMVEELKKLHAALDASLSEPKPKDDVSAVVLGPCNSLLSSKSTSERLLEQLFSRQ